MIGRADDALVFCLIAAALVVLAHAIDALGSRKGDGDGWANSLALSLCGLALGILVVGATIAPSRTDLLLTMSTAGAVIVSALPLVGFRAGDGENMHPANPWDRAFRVRRSRVSELLSPTPRPQPADPPRARRGPATPPGTPREGVIMPAVDPRAAAAQPPPRRLRHGPARLPPPPRSTRRRRPCTTSARSWATSAASSASTDASTPAADPVM
ncbi:hypothetical protein [Mobilicoccus caccae]|uniref:Uncharacterized protein n=1 Tax=Mobilicoccus caccae TaxID=1859295 RepID=A0ABQ6IVH6_9MICO|nr:hypothetical protein [Mobilicoccus caccae]GMA41147.1 hypothetical protein GCM10025883_31920 [Mobilicoccus caccae]